MVSFRVWLFALLSNVSSAAGVVSRQDNPAPTVSIHNGTIQGLHHPTYNQDFFLGIPYAEPPLENLRFRYPEPLKSVWNGTLDATAYYPECIGYGGDQIGYDISEDCLVVNVVKPAGYEGKDLPVGVWIHGGG